MSASAYTYIDMYLSRLKRNFVHGTRMYIGETHAADRRLQHHPHRINQIQHCSTCGSDHQVRPGQVRSERSEPDLLSQVRSERGELLIDDVLVRAHLTMSDHATHNINLLQYNHTQSIKNLPGISLESLKNLPGSDLSGIYQESLRK